jgi:predicted metal-dependent hydrolase
MIPFRVRKSRGKRISLRFSAQASLLEIRTPSGRYGPSEKRAVAAQADWILKHFEARQGLWQQREEMRQRLLAGQGLYMGQEVPIHYHQAEHSRITYEAQALHLHLSPQDWGQPRMYMLYRGLRSLAAGVLKPMVHDLAQQTNSRINQVRVKDVVSRWGSCSSKGNINLNWYLVMLEPDLIDYLIVHELMHLREMNHSERYWAWVAHYYPDYQKADRQLSESEWLIGLFDPWVKGE